MGNWIEEAAHEYQTLVHETEANTAQIKTSQFWSLIRQQIEQDVDNINENAIFKKALGDDLILIKELATGFEVQKPTEPAAFITIQNNGHEIEVQTQVGRDKDIEFLSVLVSNGRVILKGRNSTYSIPEQASRHFLKPILDSFKKALEVGK